MKYVFFVCGRGVAQASFYPHVGFAPALSLKKSKKDTLEANRETPTKPQSFLDDLATTD